MGASFQRLHAVFLLRAVFVTVTGSFVVIGGFHRIEGRLSCVRFIVFIGMEPIRSLVVLRILLNRYRISSDPSSFVALRAGEGFIVDGWIIVAEFGCRLKIDAEAVAIRKQFRIG